MLLELDVFCLSFYLDLHLGVETLLATLDLATQKALLPAMLLSGTFLSISLPPPATMDREPPLSEVLSHPSGLREGAREWASFYPKERSLSGVMVQAAAHRILSA